jgi:hypothetical protein
LPSLFLFALEKRGIPRGGLFVGGRPDPVIIWIARKIIELDVAAIPWLVG